MEKVDLVKGQLLWQSSRSRHTQYYVMDGCLEVFSHTLSLGWIHSGGLINEIQVLLQRWPDAVIRCQSMTASVYKVHRDTLSGILDEHAPAGKRSKMEFAAIREFIESRDKTKVPLIRPPVESQQPYDIVTALRQVGRYKSHRRCISLL